MDDGTGIEQHRRAARAARPELREAVPEAWAFCAAAEHADSA